MNELTGKNGIKNLTAVLDQTYLKDESTWVYEAYKMFAKLVRAHNMTRTDYVIKFEKLYFKARSFNMKILDSVIAYRFIQR